MMRRTLRDYAIVIDVVSSLEREKLKHQLPNSRAGIYNYVGFIQTLLDHMVTKDLENVATDKSIDEYQENFAK